ncbi:MAG: protein kinase [Polyangiaceae bacterium]
MDLAVGQVYGGKYRIVRLMGQGSMGAVYEGENVRIRRRVAIKTLHPGMAEKGDTLQRFEREAKAAGHIGSAHIVEVLDMGDLPDGSRYMVMEYLDGVTLQQHIRTSGRLTPQEASPIVQQLLEGLGAAHATGIIHRDLKPANVFLVRQPGRPDFVKILDFGVSKFSVLSEEMSMTRTGAVLGTPYYMSPEQAKGARGTDARSDLYAVGVILYECITGQVPFSADTFNELLFRIVLESPPPAESFVPDLSPEMAAIIRKSMAREPADRYQTAGELKQALAEWSANAEADATPNFDGLTTMDAKTVMRTSPFAAPGLRPAPPSTTASAAVVMGGAPAQPAVAALGTVIIDPGIAPSPAPGAPANGAPP